MSGNNIDVHELLDSRDVSAYQKFIVFISFLIVVMDGFDVVIMRFVGPALKEAWNWTNSDLAPVLSAALFGLTFGALTAGPLGDKFGRRKVLTASVFIFGLFTLLVATASSKQNSSFIALLQALPWAVSCRWLLLWSKNTRPLNAHLYW